MRHTYNPISVQLCVVSAPAGESDQDLDFGEGYESAFVDALATGDTYQTVTINRNLRSPSSEYGQGSVGAASISGHATITDIDVLENWQPNSNSAPIDHVS
jgi:hypothetical protein